MSEHIVIFGAGNIGRSFVGQIFGRAGYRVTFVDLDVELVRALNRDGHYHVVHRHPDGGEEMLDVPGVRAIDARDTAAVVAAAADARYIATSVGAQALPHILPHIGAAAVTRARAGADPFDVILAENIHGAGEQTRRALADALAAAGLAAVAGHSAPAGHSAQDSHTTPAVMPGVVECSVGKMVPLVPAELRAAHPTTVWAEAYNTLVVDANGFHGELPDVPELLPVSPIAAWVERKLYIHNLGHAATAYIAAARAPGTTLISEAVKNPAVRPTVEAAMRGAADALVGEYPAVFTTGALYEHIEDLLYRFASPTLGDTVYRVGRDVPRKLGPSDRIMGAWRLMQRHSVDTSALEEVMRAACHFAVPDEHGALHPPDRAFRAAFDTDPRDTLSNVCGLSGADPLDAALIARISINQYR